MDRRTVILPRFRPPPSRYLPAVLRLELKYSSCVFFFPRELPPPSLQFSVHPGRYSPNSRLKNHSNTAITTMSSANSTPLSETSLVLHFRRRMTLDALDIFDLTHDKPWCTIVLRSNCISFKQSERIYARVRFLRHYSGRYSPVAYWIYGWEFPPSLRKWVRQLSPKYDPKFQS